MSAPGQLGQVEPVPAADVGDCLGAGEPGQPEDRGGQVDPRALELVDLLPGRQVRVRAVLLLPQVVPVGQQDSVVSWHGKAQ